MQGLSRPTDRTQQGLADRLERIRDTLRRDLAHLRRHRLRHQVLPQRQDHSDGRGSDALACLNAAVAEAERILGLDDLRDDRGEFELVDENTGEIIDIVLAPIAVVSDNGSCFRGETYQAGFAGDDPLLRHVRTGVRSPQTNGVIERFFGTLKYEHLWLIAEEGVFVV